MPGGAQKIHTYIQKNVVGWILLNQFIDVNMTIFQVLPKLIDVYSIEIFLPESKNLASSLT